tara:strand:- start:93 stop:425 length:333 start_codon:yes stop_codon:yes gene_type:complete
MEKKIITQRLARTYTWSFIIALVSFFVAFYIVAVERDSLGQVATLMLIIGIISQWVWLISLGMCASRLGRRVIVWVGLTILFGPFSLLIVFPLMRGHISKALGTHKKDSI